MKRAVSLTLLIAWGLSLSCDSVEPAFQYPLTHVKSEILPMGKWRIFNSKGEVTDKNTFRDLAYEDDTATFRYAAENYILNSAAIDIVRIMSANEAWVQGYPNAPDCSVASNESGFVLTLNDTTTAGICGERMSRHLNYFIGSVKPEIYSEYLSSSTAGNFCFGYRGRQKFVFNGHHFAFYAPYVLFILRTQTGSDPPGYASATRLNNNLDHDFYKHLGENQSVSLMEYQLLFERK